MHVRNGIFAILVLMVLAVPLAAQDVASGDLPALYGVSASEVRAVYPADEVPILRNATLFYLVSHKGLTVPEGLATASEIRCNASSNLTIRDSVGTGSKLGSLPMGAVAEVIAHGSMETRDGSVRVPFLQIRYGDVTGWVLGLSRWVDVTANEREVVTEGGEPEGVIPGEPVAPTESGPTLTPEELENGDAVAALRDAWIATWMADHPGASLEEAEAAWNEVADEELAAAGVTEVAEEAVPVEEAVPAEEAADEAEAAAVVEAKLYDYLLETLAVPMTQGLERIPCPLCVADETALSAHPFPAWARVNPGFVFDESQDESDGAFFKRIIEHLASEHGIPSAVLTRIVTFLNDTCNLELGVPEGYEETPVVEADAQGVAEPGDVDLETLVSGEAIFTNPPSEANLEIYNQTLKSIQDADRSDDAGMRTVAEAKFLCLIKLIDQKLVGLNMERLRAIEEAWLVAEGVIPADQTLSGQINLSAFPGFRRYMTNVRRLYASHLGKSEKGVAEVAGTQFLGLFAAVDGFRHHIGAEAEAQAHAALVAALGEVPESVTATYADGSTVELALGANAEGELSGLASRLVVLPYLVRTLRAMNPTNFSPLVMLCLADRFRLDMHMDTAGCVPHAKALELLAADGLSRADAQQIVLAIFKARSWGVALDMDGASWSSLQELYLKNFVKDASDMGDARLPLSMSGDGLGVGRDLLKKLRERLGTYLGQVEKNAVEKALEDVIHENDNFRTATQLIGQLHTGAASVGHNIIGGIAQGIGKHLPITVTVTNQDGESTTVENGIEAWGEAQQARAHELDLIRRTLNDVSEVMDWTLNVVLEIFQGKDRVAALCLLDRLDLDARDFPGLVDANR